MIIDYREDAIWTVYVHKNKTNGKCYVGITKQKPCQRWCGGSGYRDQPFYNAIKKYGWKGFDHIIVAEHLTMSEASDMERVLIEKLHSTFEEGGGYNIKPGGIDGYRYGKHICSFTLDGKYEKTFNSMGELQAEYNCSSTNVYKVCSGEFNSAASHIFMYEEDWDGNDIDPYKAKWKGTPSPVNQYDKDFNLIGEYDSVNKASIATGIPEMYISDVCNGRQKTTRGFIFRYKGQDPHEDITVKYDYSSINPDYKYSSVKPVISTDDDNIETYYESIKEAAELHGIPATHISRVCRGRRKRTGGLIWRYATLEEINNHTSQIDGR